MILSTKIVTEALEHYGIRATNGTRATAGEAITVTGMTNGTEKTMVLQSAAYGVTRLVPLAAAGAGYLARNFRGHHHLDASEQKTRMLEHLLLRISEFFSSSGVDAFELKIRLHENTYAVTDASARAQRALHFEKRLTPHAHDRKDTGMLSQSVTEPRR